jgi:NAD(P)-dependent dehydrogenase (short-subunit alcohol dehydrogenase family)
MTGSTDLCGQVSVVTGGGRGLGRAFAQALAGAGSVIAVVARSAAEIAETVALIERAGGQARAFTAGDLRDRSAPRRIEGVRSDRRRRGHCIIFGRTVSRRIFHTRLLGPRRIISAQKAAQCARMTVVALM